MDGTDKFINNRAPKKLVMIFLIIFILSVTAGWILSGECADYIVSRQIESMLSVAGGGKFTGIPSAEHIAEGEKIYESMGISHELSPRFMSDYPDIRNRIFLIIIIPSGAVCLIGMFFSIRQTYCIYNDLESLRAECLEIAEQTRRNARLYGEDFSCVRRVSESINLIAERMNYLNGTLIKEKNFLGEFLSDFSHQLKTSLAVIRLNSDMISEMVNLSEEKRQKLSQEIEEHLDGMESLIISALKLAKLKADAIEYKMENSDISVTCRNAVKKIAPLLRSKGITADFVCDKAVTLKHDCIWLCEAIENIIKNSADHAECTHISVELSSNPATVTVVISDNGKGIPQEEIPGIFERFGKKSGSTSMSSTGIGMSIAKKIAEAHKGEILVYSSIGKGTRFEIVFLK